VVPVAQIWQKLAPEPEYLPDTQGVAAVAPDLGT